MTFGELQIDVYEDTGANNPMPTTQTVARISKNINKAHRKILTEPGLIRLRHTGMPIQFDTEADRFLYGLPPSLSSVRALTERDTTRILFPKTIDEIREEDPGFTRQDTPWAFVPIGYKVIQRAPDSTGLWVASTSSSDSTPVVQVVGVRASSIISAEESATLTGTTRVALGTITDYVDVISLSVSQTCVGVVSLYDAAASGNVLAEIPIGAQTSQYFMLQIYPTPSDVVTYYVDGTYRIVTLQDAQDTPQLPEEFHDMLSDYAKEQECIKAGEGQKALYWRSEFDGKLPKLRQWVSSQGAETPVISRRFTPRVSRYGANMPVGPF